MAKAPVVLVVGSVNMDLVVRAEHIPAPGETVLGRDFITCPGGKGANQAVAVARLGAQCRMLARLGDDAFGDTLLAGLKAEGIDCRGVTHTKNTPSGIAIILLDRRGQNSIVVASGANHKVTPADLASNERLFRDVAVVVLQLELPPPTVAAAVRMARKHGCRVVLDPAPAMARLPRELFRVDVISPNVSETKILTGIAPVDEPSARRAATKLLACGAGAVVLKLDARGCFVATRERSLLVPPFKVKVVDTTAAGDAFTAALAVALAQGCDLADAALVANAAGALACTKLGAQPSMPAMSAVRALVKKRRVTPISR